jgi:hypothetical protein
VVAGCDTPPVFEAGDGVFGPVVFAIEVSVMRDRGLRPLCDRIQRAIPLSIKALRNQSAPQPRSASSARAGGMDDRRARAPW